MNDKLIHIISTNYPNIKPISIDKIDGGLTNYNFKIKGIDGQNYFTKIFRLATDKEVNTEVRLVDYLSNNEILVPEIYVNKDKKKYTTSGNITLVVYEYIEGDHPLASKDDARNIGELIASMHLLPTPSYIPVGYTTSFDEVKSDIGGLSVNIDGKTKKLLLDSINLCVNVKTSTTPIGLIHTDVFLDNCIKSLDNRIYLIDFEEAVVGNYLFDIGRSILGCCMKNGLIDIKITNSLLEGYTKKRQLTKIDTDEIYDWLLFSILVSVMWRYTEFNINRPNENKNDLYKEFIPSLKLIKKLGKERFIRNLF